MINVIAHPALSYKIDRVEDHRNNAQIRGKAASVIVRNLGTVTARVNNVVIRAGDVLELDAGQPIVKFENGVMHIIPLAMELETQLTFDVTEAAAPSAVTWVQLVFNSFKQ